jgi:hypothetical protein
MLHILVLAGGPYTWNSLGGGLQESALPRRRDDVLIYIRTHVINIDDASNGARCPRLVVPAAKVAQMFSKAFHLNCHSEVEFSSFHPHFHMPLIADAKSCIPLQRSPAWTINAHADLSGLDQ